jgi:hypothetical protein
VRLRRTDQSLQFIDRHHPQQCVPDFCAFKDGHGEEGRGGGCPSTIMTALRPLSAGRSAGGGQHGSGWGWAILGLTHERRTSRMVSFVLYDLVGHGDFRGRWVQ